MSTGSPPRGDLVKVIPMSPMSRSVAKVSDVPIIFFERSSDVFSKRSIFFSGCGGLAGLCISKTSFPMPPAVKFKGRTCRASGTLVPPNSRVALAEHLRPF